MIAKYMFANEQGHLSPTYGSLLEAECEAVAHIVEHGGKRIILTFTAERVWQPIAIARITGIPNDTPIVYTTGQLAHILADLENAAMLAEDRRYQDTALGEVQ